MLSYTTPVHGTGRDGYGTGRDGIDAWGRLNVTKWPYGPCLRYTGPTGTISHILALRALLAMYWPYGPY